MLAELGFDVTSPDTNLVFVDPRPVGLSADVFAGAMADHGVEISTIGARNRFCTHLDVTAEEVESALDTVRDVLAKNPTDALTASPERYA